MTFPSGESLQIRSFLYRLAQIDLYGSVCIKEQLPECRVVSTGHPGQVPLTTAAGCLQGGGAGPQRSAPTEVAAAEGPGSVHQGAALAEEAQAWR